MQAFLGRDMFTAVVRLVSAQCDCRMRLHSFGHVGRFALLVAGILIAVFLQLVAGCNKLCVDTVTSFSCY